MLVRALGAASVLAGVTLLYVARRAWRHITCIDDEEQFDDAVYGRPMDAVEGGLAFGVLLIFFGLALAFRLI